MESKNEIVGAWVDEWTDVPDHLAILSLAQLRDLSSRHLRYRPTPPRSASARKRKAARYWRKS